MNNNDLELLLAGRTAIDLFVERVSVLDDSDATQSARHTEATNAMMEVLAALGFSVFQAFIDFNEMMCLQAIEECRKWSGTCDLCGGEIEQPPCFLLYGAHSCFAKGGEHLTEGRSRRQLRMWRANAYTIQAWNDDGDISFFCPPGHGRYIKAADWKEFPFDITWGEQWRY